MLGATIALQPGVFPSDQPPAPAVPLFQYSLTPTPTAPSPSRAPYYLVGGLLALGVVGAVIWISKRKG